MTPESIIRRPIFLTEKSNTQRHGNQFVFEVLRDANKIQIKEAVETLFKVKVTAINTLHVRPKDRRVRGAISGLTSAWKKAIVTLAEGQKIEGI